MSRASSSAKSTNLLFGGYLLLILIEYSGVAHNFLPILNALRVATLLNYGLFLATLAQVGVGDLFRLRQTKILLTLVLFTTVSVLWALVQTFTFESIRPLVDYTVFFYLTLSLVDRKERIDALSWAFVVLIAFLTLINLDGLTSAARSGVFLGSYFMGDGNDFAWFMAVTLPLALNLASGQRALLTRCAGLFGAACCVFSIVGTSSRGATVGLAAVGLYYLFVISRRKVLSALILVVVAGSALVLAPPTYVERMQTISEYEEDNSAMTRLQAWGAAVEMSIDYPLGVGAGNFSSAYGMFYIPEDSTGWAAQRWIGAHSIYFKTLGEYGLLGVVLLLWLIVGNLRDNSVVRKALKCKPDEAPFDFGWPALVALSVVAHAACGLFLGGIAYPHLFLLCGLTAANVRLARRGGLLPATTRKPMHLRQGSRAA